MCRMYIYQDLLLVFPLSLFILYPNSATKLARQRYQPQRLFIFGGSMQPLNCSLPPPRTIAGHRRVSSIRR